jgi:putative flippase GtrA
MGFIKDMYMKYREAVLYVICGGFTTLVSWASYALFVWAGMELNLSNILSWICAVLFAFVVNKWIVFESRSTEGKTVAKELSLFFGARIFTGVLSWILFPILLWMGLNQTILGTEGLIAKIIVTIVEIALNWIFSKYMIFKKKDTC